MVKANIETKNVEVSIREEQNMDAIRIIPKNRYGIKQVTVYVYPNGKTVLRVWNNDDVEETEIYSAAPEMP